MGTNRKDEAHVGAATAQSLDDSRGAERAESHTTQLDRRAQAGEPELGAGAPLLAAEAGSLSRRLRVEPLLRVGERSLIELRRVAPRSLHGLTRPALGEVALAERHPCRLCRNRRSTKRPAALASMGLVETT